MAIVQVKGEPEQASSIIGLTHKGLPNKYPIPSLFNLRDVFKFKQMEQRSVNIITNKLFAPSQKKNK